MLQTLRTNPLPTPEPPSPHQATLDELTQLGLDLAHHVQQQALATTDATELANLTAAFDRTARTVRRTVLLSQHLQAQPHPISPARARELVRRDAIRALGDDTFHRPQPERQALEREFLDRLDHPDTELDLLDTPTQHVIDTIRRDLGLVTVAGHTIFKRRTPAETQALNQQARTTPQHPTAAIPPAPTLIHQDPSAQVRCPPDVAAQGCPVGLFSQGDSGRRCRCGRCTPGSTAGCPAATATRPPAG